MGSLSQVQLEQSDSRRGIGLKPVLKISNLCVSFMKRSGFLTKRKQSPVNAVDNVSFEIYENEVLSLVGESGSGKTTIARSIMSLVKPDSGSIKYNGIEVTALNGMALLNYRREVQMIYQDPYESL